MKNARRAPEVRQSLAWEEACLGTRRSIFARRRRLSQFHILPSDRVLDVGCGDGLDIDILRTLGILNIVGLDPSAYLLTQARLRNPGARYVRGSAEKLPFGKHSFDVVLVDSVFHHLKNWPKPLAQIHRVLRKGGRLYFIEPHRSIVRAFLDWVSLLPGSQIVPFLGARAVAYRQEKHLMESWLMHEDQFLEMLTVAGFKRIFVRRDILSIVGAYVKR